MKTYVLTVSQYFPATHLRKGEPTDFVTKIMKMEKIHTIRGNYDLWKHRANEINAGRARLSVRVWTGTPYKSKQREVFAFVGIGVQKIEPTLLGWFVDDCESNIIVSELAKNDGLYREDFTAWFEDWPWDTPKAIIHFTDFRYK